MVRKLTFSVILLFIGISTFAQQQDIRAKSNPVMISVGQQVIANAKPVLTWISPQNEISEVKQTTSKVKVGINSVVKLRSVSLYINGVANSDRGFGIKSDEDAQYDEVLDKDVVLSEGDNEIKVIAENINGVKTIETRVITVALPTLANRTDYALLIGSNDYEYWNDLVNPVPDAKAIQKELQDVYGFKTELLTNPTKKDLVAKLREYSKKSYLDDDQLFIFIAGHGQFDPFFNQGYLVTHESRLDDEEKLSYFSHSNLREIVNNIPCKHIFLTIDACFGGTFDPAIARAGSRGQDIYQELPKAEFIKRKLQYRTRYYLTSGGKQYVSDGVPGRHSPFAAKFLEVLRSYGGQDGIITLAQFKSAMERVVPEPRFGEFGTNEPGSDFVFVVQDNK